MKIFEFRNTTKDKVVTWLLSLSGIFELSNDKVFDFCLSVIKSRYRYNLIAFCKKVIDEKEEEDKKFNQDQRNLSYFKEFNKKIKEANQTGRRDIVFDYRSISLSFPDKSPRQDRLGNYWEYNYQFIDWAKLNEWASINFWKVTEAKEISHHDQQDTPFIRFTKIIHKEDNIKDLIQ